MTADGLVGDLLAPDRGGREPASQSVSAILSLCDRLLGEIGRRSHFFAWLRPPGSGAEDWLTVDSYFPGNRLVVIWRVQDAPHDDLYAELVPAHGLRLLKLTPDDVVDDYAGARLALERLIAELPRREPPTEPPAFEGAVARVVASLAQARAAAAPVPARDPAHRPRTGAAAAPVQARAPTHRPRGGGSQAAAAERGARFVAAHRAQTPRRALPVPPTADRPRMTTRPRPRASPSRNHGGEVQTLGIVVGLVLAAVLGAELYLGVADVGLKGGHVLLAFGIALDACSRALGPIAAARAGRQDWAWWCVAGGFPVVAAFALFQRAGPVTIDPAPLAGLVSVLAGVVVVIAILRAALGL
jgi:hypothetical protein